MPRAVAPCYRDVAAKQSLNGGCASLPGKEREALLHLLESQLRSLTVVDPILTQRRLDF